MAQITINVPDEHVPLIKEAIADFYSIPPQDVTIAQVREAFMILLQARVRDYRREKALRDATYPDIGDGS